MLLQKLKGFDPQKFSMDEMIELHALGSVMRTSYSSFQMEVPEDLDDALGTISREIQNRYRDELERELKITRAKIAETMTATEKREALRDKEARLKAKLAGPQQATGTNG